MSNEVKIVPDAKLPIDLRVVQHGQCIVKVYGENGQPNMARAELIAAALRAQG